MGTQHDGGESDLAPVIPLFDRRPAGSAEPPGGAAGLSRGGVPPESAHPAVRARWAREAAQDDARSDDPGVTLEGEDDGSAPKDVNAGIDPRAGPGRREVGNGRAGVSEKAAVENVMSRPVLRRLGDAKDAATVSVGDDPDRTWHITWQRDSADEAGASTDVERVAEDEDDDEARVGEAEHALLRTLRRRSLSVAEAQTRLRGHEVPKERVEEIISRLIRLGALDDAALAEQLVHTAVNRKSQGRRAIAQTLSSRGVEREAIDSALSALPDDDAERALEYARGKAVRLVRYDDDTALRRLIGQLSRRGFGGGVALTAARTALEEARGGGGVRFR